MSEDKSRATEPAEQQLENLRTVYKELCTSYRAIDDFRTKLLALLPLATGGGIFLLAGDEKKIEAIEKHLPYVGLFGFVVTLGLFFFELHGILKCTHLIKAGTKLEEALGIKENGQFVERPLGFLGFINEPFAAGVIYPAVLAAWAYMAIHFSLKQDVSACGWKLVTLPFNSVSATEVFIGGFAVAFVYNLWLILPPCYKKRYKKMKEKKMSDRNNATDA